MTSPEYKFGTLPPSRLIEVTATFRFVLPTEATRDQIEEWVKFELGIEPDMAGGNPLENDGIDILSGDVLLTDTEKHVHETVRDGKDGYFYTSRKLEDFPYLGPSRSDQLVALSNASKASPPGAELTISNEAGSETVSLIGLTSPPPVTRGIED